MVDFGNRKTKVLTLIRAKEIGSVDPDVQGQRVRHVMITETSKDQAMYIISPADDVIDVTWEKWFCSTKRSRLP